MPDSSAQRYSSDFAPKLRLDLQFYRGSSPQVMVVADPVSGRRHQLYEIECLLAQAMDGSRTLDDLTDRARDHVSTASRSEVEKLIGQLAALGLLENAEPSASPPRNGAGAGPAEGSDPDPRHDGSAPEPERAEAEELVVRSGDLPDLNPDAIEEGGAAEEEPWTYEAPPWHARPSIRRALKLALVASALGLSALIPYPHYVTEECAVLPLARMEVRAQVEGLIHAILVDEGALVTASEVIARLDDREVVAALAQARADAQRLRANLEKTRRGSRPEEIARSSAVVDARAKDLSYAEIESERRERLLQRGVGNAEERDRAKRDLEVKSMVLKEARAEHRLLRAGFREEEIQIAAAELERAEVEVRYLETKQELLTIRSPIDGQILTPRFREHLHRRVEAGETIFEVADMRRVRVEIFVPESEQDVVKLGQPTVVKVVSYPLLPFRGRVTFIAPAVALRGEERFIRVVTEIDNEEGLLREGMTGYGEIETGRASLLWLAMRRLVRWARVRLLI